MKCEKRHSFQYFLACTMLVNWNAKEDPASVGHAGQMLPWSQEIGHRSHFNPKLIYKSCTDSCSCFKRTVAQHKNIRRPRSRCVSRRIQSDCVKRKWSNSLLPIKVVQICQTCSYLPPAAPVHANSRSVFVLVQLKGQLWWASQHH